MGVKCGLTLREDELERFQSTHIREGHRLRVCENRELRRIFGSKREEVAGGWRRLRNEELHNLYASPYVITVTELRRMRWRLGI